MTLTHSRHIPTLLYNFISGNAQNPPVPPSASLTLCILPLNPEPTTAHVIFIAIVNRFFFEDIDNRFIRKGWLKFCTFFKQME
jgi:hypothetical protein